MPAEEGGRPHSGLGPMTVTPHPGVQPCPFLMCGLRWGCKVTLPDTHTSGTQGLCFSIAAWVLLKSPCPWARPQSHHP